MFVDFIIQNFKDYAEKDAVIVNDRIFNYRYLLDKYEGWLNYIDKSVGENKVVAIQSDYCPDSITLFLALLETRNIVVPFSLTNKNLEDKVKIAEADFFFEFNENSFNVNSLSAPVKHKFIEVLFQRKNPGIIIFSSGSTGKPKAAIHDFAYLLNKFKVKRKTLRTINFLLFDHWGGINTLLYILSNAGVVAIPKERTPESICEFIQQYQIELLPTTPTFLNLLLLNKPWRKYDLSSLKMITYGTEPVYESTLKAITSALPHVEFKQTYGLTELGVFRTKSRSSDSLWLKVGGEDYFTKIIDGILYVKAKTSIIGYLNAESPFDEEGWYNTGDRVEVDGEWIRFLGRESDVINVGGLKVFPAEVESVLMQIPQIEDCMVYGEKNAMMGNFVAAEVVLRDKINNTEIRSVIRLFCKDKLETYKIPVRIKIVEKTNIGERFKKIRRH
ncbi:MAG: long-chain fatty acid--CoA ligase [Bacteroidales bacterium]|nr:long-chain fatty acid--CoA ligase [Bacteroidales bacterium]